MKVITSFPPQGSPERRRVAGFTLLEVMIALAIAAIALSSLLGLANRNIAVHGRLRHTTVATQLAQYRMSEVESGRREPADDEGGFDPPFAAYGWRIETGSTPFSAVRRVTVTVFWDETRPELAVDLTSFIQLGEMTDAPAG